MRIALAYDYLNQSGGGERVLEALCQLFPEAPIYTILYDQEKTYNRFAGRKIFTSFLDFPLARNNHRFFIPLMPMAIGSLKIPDDYDVVISVTAGFGKGIRCGPNTKHISYCFTPLRYAWEPKLANVPSWATFIKKPLLKYLKNWDYRMAQKPDVLLTLSKFIASKMQSYYGR